MTENVLEKILIWVLPVVFAITVHEVAHGWVAKKLGDPTASSLGRLTLNPIKHIDFFGTIILPLILVALPTPFVFGWAKPVPVDPRNFKSIRKDMALVAAAGPVSNLLMAIAWALFIRLAFVLNSDLVSLTMVYMGIAGISINLVLMILNLLPVPPLDGSRILSAVLPLNIARLFNRFERYGFIILLFLMWQGFLKDIIGQPFMQAQQMLLVLAGLPL